jgi:hypothetical protein
MRTDHSLAGSGRPGIAAISVDNPPLAARAKFGLVGGADSAFVIWRRSGVLQIIPALGHLSREQVAAILSAPDRRTWSGRRDAVLPATA